MNFFRKIFRRKPRPTVSGAVTIGNPYGQVAFSRGDAVRFTNIPKLRFTGQTATSKQVIAALQKAGINGPINLADTAYGQLEARSARQLALWLKRVMDDLGYHWTQEATDCDNFARHFRSIPDLFAGGTKAQPAVGSIYAKMNQPFAGIRDGNHALNIVWTDLGILVFEPQGLDLTYQLLDAWPNKSGIYNVQGD